MSEEDTNRPKLTTTTGPFKEVTFLGHVDAATYDTEAGEVGACVNEADRNLILRSALPKLHSDTTEEIEKISGIAREVNVDATEKAKLRAKNPDSVKDVRESWITWLNRIKETVSNEVWTEVDAYVRKTALESPLSASPTVRSGGGGLGKTYTNKADEILTRTDDEIEEVVTKLLTAVPDFELDRDEESERPTRDSLAMLVKKFTESI